MRCKYFGNFSSAKHFANDIIWRGLSGGGHKGQWIRPRFSVSKSTKFFSGVQEVVSKGGNRPTQAAANTRNRKLCGLPKPSIAGIDDNTNGSSHN